MSYMYAMTTTSYTLKEIANLLSLSGETEEVDRLARQIRHWTSLDLLVPIGKKHTGTGVSRRYDVSELRKAAILAELAHYRVPVTVLDDCFGTMIEEYTARQEWQDAITGRRPVFLVLAFNDDMIQTQLFAEPASHPMLSTSTGEKAVEWVSAITINLTRLFKRLER